MTTDGDNVMLAVLAISIALNLVLAFVVVTHQRSAERFQLFMRQREHHRERVAQALVSRFRYLANAHREDYGKLNSGADLPGRQGQAIRIMRGGFNGLATAYNDAADDVQRFIVWELNADELLKEADGIDVPTASPASSSRNT